MAQIDHLVYHVADLDSGMDDAERDYGVRPAVGGRHEGRGTHNALLSFGDCYLELIAADPSQPEPPHPRPFGIDELDEPGFITFAVRPDDGETLPDLIGAMRRSGVDPGDAVPMSRATPDGALLRWHLTFPDLHHGGAVPFLIDWGDTPQPSATAPRGPRLDRLRVETEEPELVAGIVEALGLGHRIDVEPGSGAIRPSFSRR